MAFPRQPQRAGAPVAHAPVCDARRPGCGSAPVPLLRASPRLGARRAPLQETTALYDQVRAGRLPAERASPADLPPPSLAPTDTPAIQEPVIAAAYRIWQGARGKRSGCAIGVGGPTGSGKTWVLEALAARVLAAAGVVLSARCYEPERGLAFGTVIELVGAARRRCPDLASSLGEEGRFALERLLDGTDEAHGSGPIRLYLGVGQILAACGEDRPVLVTVDDAQWIDDASAQLLAYLMRRPELEAGVTVMAWQLEAGLTSSLRSALEDAVTAGNGELLAPRRLTPEDVAELLRARGIASIEPGALAALTDGLPLLVTAYLDAAMVDSGLSVPGPVPPTVRELLRQRLDRAPETTAQVLSAVAVLGGHSDPELIRMTSGRSDAEVADALDDAVERGLLIEHANDPAAGGGSYAFAYDVMREVTYDTCGAARRRLLHGRAADALAHRYGAAPSTARPSLVANHLQSAGRALEAAQWEWQAAHRSAALFAHEEALAHARAALELGYDSSEPRLAIAEALIALGRYDEAVGQLELSASQEQLDDVGLAAIEQRLASVHDRMGDWSAAAAHLDTALSLARADPITHARIQADRALIAYRLGEAEAAEFAETAREEATTSEPESTGDALALAQALNVSGVLAARRGDLAAAESLLRQSVSAADTLLSHSPPRPGPKVSALNNLARVLADAGRLADGLELAEEALGLGLAAGDVHRVAALHSNLADLLHAVGRREEALSHLKEAASLFAAVSPVSQTDFRTSPQLWTLVEW